MGLLSIGAFARASRLSPKALRLYDELGLLPPARVDPVTGYRSYAPEQLERARLVAWLRRLGMPLARIREVCELDASGAAREVRAFWARVEADTAARRDLAAFLVDHLFRKEPAMSRTTAPLEIRYAALSDRGLVRESDQDTAYADARLLAVADGFGGDGASEAAVDVLKSLDTDGVPAGDLLNVLEEAIERANLAVRGVAASGSEVGTTLTAMLWTGSRLALVHIGDSRAYVLRDGELFQITHDHTLVQSMVDEGRISPEEAASHPQRALLAKALAGGTEATATCACTTYGPATATCSVPTACRRSYRPGRRTGSCPRSPNPNRRCASWSRWPTAPAGPTTSAAWSPTCGRSPRDRQRLGARKLVARLPPDVGGGYGQP